MKLRLEAWADGIRAEAVERWPDMPPSIQDRAADVWEPLLTVADLAGGEWPDAARVAAVTLVTASMSGSRSIGVMLLRDVRAIFDATRSGRLVTDQLIQNLKEIEDSPWAVIRKGEPIDARALAQRLRKYGIEPKALATGSSRVTRAYSSRTRGPATCRPRPSTHDARKGLLRLQNYRRRPAG